MKIGFIGCGNMGGAMARGILDAHKCQPQDMMVSALSAETVRKRKEELGVQATMDNRQVAQFADVLFLAVKPQYYPEVIAQVKDDLRAEQIVVSLAPGKTLAWLAKEFGRPCKLIRTMPNTPSLVKEGMMGICANEQVTAQDLAVICDLGSGFSRVEQVPERLMDVVTGVSGSSPAYVFLFIEALADAAVSEGMPRAQAYRFAAQSVLGSAKMVLETGKHPAELKDMVCSPGGTTIEAVRVLEEKGLRSAVFEATKACVKKAGEM